jgi:superfamily II DNA or RNA helicase
MENAKIVSPNGYGILFDTLTDKEIKTIKKELTFKPFDPTGYTKFVNNEFSVYRENEKRIYMPRFYGLKKFGNPDKDKLKLQEDNKCNFSFLAPESNNTSEKGKIQKDAIDNVVKNLTTIGGALLVLPCGYGKTYTAIKIWSIMKVKCLVLVHKDFLAEQWKEEIQKLTNAKIGIIKGKKVLTENCDIVIAMIPSLMVNDYDLKGFQMIIADECHHLAAPSFSKVLNKIACKYMLGLSATPERDDKLETVFKYYLGDTAFEYVEPPNPDVDIEFYHFADTGQKEYTEIFTPAGKRSKSRMITNLSGYDARNDFIVDKIAELVKLGRDVIVTSGRRGKENKGDSDSDSDDDTEKNNSKDTVGNSFQQLKILADKLLTKYNIESVTYVGGDKVSKLKEMDTKKVLFSIYQMVEEGFNCPKLNTMIYATPITKTKQIRGRIMRQKHEKFRPLIIDIIDCFSNFKNQANQRKNQYVKAGYNIKNFYWTNGIVTGEKPKKNKDSSNKNEEENYEFIE